METYMDYVTTARTLFRDLGGVTQMIARLHAEITAGLAEPERAVDSSSPNQSTIAFPRRNLIKFLLRAIALASYSPTSTARPQASLGPDLVSSTPRLSMASTRHTCPVSCILSCSTLILPKTLSKEYKGHEQLLLPAARQL